MDYYNGYVNQQVLKKELGFDGRVNPIIEKSERREYYRRSFEIRELQQFIRRYRWSGLPEGLDANLMERILYYRGRIVLFKLGERFYTLPFALNGNIDVYGRYNGVSPLTFNGSIATDEDGNNRMEDGIFIPDLIIKPCYDVNNLEDKNGVILNDYSQGISEWIKPRAICNKYFNQDLADIVVLIRHNLISSAKIFSVRCADQGQADAVIEEFNNLESQMLDNGKRVFPITSPLGMEELFKDKSLDTQNYWECFVSLDNLRENMIGIENNGIFKKKERVLKGEQELEAGSADLVYQDGLFNRQQFCERCNALFGTNMWCEESEVISGSDNDYDTNLDDQEGEKEEYEDGEV